jgi:hypothetical protein
MPNKFQIKRTSISGRTPNTTNSGNTTYIDAGELALNLTDGKLFTSNGTSIIEFGTGTPVYDANGTLVTTTYVTQATNGPAFSAYGAAATSLANSAWTKVTFDTEDFDTNNCFANSRFTPSISGYYQLNSTVSMVSGTVGNMIIAIFKNGAEHKRGNRIPLGAAGGAGVIVSDVVVANTANNDYFEVYVIHSAGGSINTETGSAYGPTFTGSFVRGV